MKLPTLHRRILAGMLLIAGIWFSRWLAAALFGLHTGSGIVLDTSTNRPVPGAEVVLDCMRRAGFESRETVRVVSVTTDAEGRYHFGRRDVSGCSSGFVRASKAGYKDAADLAVRHDPSTDQDIPKTRYLAPDGVQRAESGHGQGSAGGALILMGIVKQTAEILPPAGIKGSPSVPPNTGTR